MKHIENNEYHQFSYENLDEELLLKTFRDEVMNKFTSQEFLDLILSHKKLKDKKRKKIYHYIGGVTKTLGGHKVVCFRLLDNPIDINNNEYVYCGDVFIDNNTIPTPINWDKNGKCPNHLRPDCFIDVEQIKR